LDTAFVLAHAAAAIAQRLGRDGAAGFVPMFHCWPGLRLPLIGLSGMGAGICRRRLEAAALFAVSISLTVLLSSAFSVVIPERGRGGAEDAARLEPRAPVLVKPAVGNDSCRSRLMPGLGGKDSSSWQTNSPAWSDISVSHLLART